MSISRLLEHWRSDPTIFGNIVIWKVIPPCSGRFEPFPPDLHPKLKESLTHLGYKALFSHQLISWQLVKSGKNIVITSGTGSGKTLCFNLPILDFILRDSNAHALYIFPTRALAQDQFNTLKNYGLEIVVGIYDGDTPLKERPKIRANAQIIFSNPDMLHASILPRHSYWAHFFKTLQFVVIEEIHTYRGVFGSHVANVIRRLKRIANYYGAHPLFILTSATIANPIQLAEKLIEQEVVLIDDDGAAHGEKHFIIYNPPIIEHSLGIRRSAIADTVQLAEDLFSLDIQTIIFGTTRRSVEYLLRSLQEQCATYGDPICNERIPSISGYRSGYLPIQRRKIEQRLREGKIRTVVATNALELGIDIGDINAAILVGYPGTIAATLQQAGRASRNGKPSIAVFIPSANPLDQYLAQHPDFLFDRTPEHALINPYNPWILFSHLCCTCYELPFSESEHFGNAPECLVREYLEKLSDNNNTYYSMGKFYWIDNISPATIISLRNTSPDRVILQVEEEKENTTIGEVDLESATWMVHPQAVYLHNGITYIVEKLDTTQKIAFLHRADVDYTTQPLTKTTIDVIKINESAITGGISKFIGEIFVTTQVVGYRKIKYITNEVLSEAELRLPPTSMRTFGYWFSLGREIVEYLRREGLWNNDPIDYGPNWRIQRDQARARDQYRCQICGVPEQNRSHDVHHKQPFRTFPSYLEANELSNLITLCPQCHRRAEEAVRIRSGLDGLAHLMGNLAPLLLMCDRHDLKVYSDPNSTLTQGQPTIIVSEMIPGGIGFSQMLFSLHDDLIAQAYDFVRMCGCDSGCPSCVGPGGEYGWGSKKETLAILDILVKSPCEES